MANETGAFMRWTPKESLAVGANAIRFLDKGMGIVDAINEAQKLALPPYRWREHSMIARIEGNTKQNGGWNRHVIAARVLPAEELEALLIDPPKTARRVTTPAPTPAPTPGIAPPLGTKIKWTLLQECRVARAVDALRSTMPKGASLTALVMAAQGNVLPLEFQRTRKALSMKDYKGELAVMLARGKSASPQFASWQLDGRPEPLPPAPPPAPESAAAAPEPAPAPVEAPRADGKRRFLDLDVKPWPNLPDRSRNLHWTTLEKAKFARVWDATDLEGVALARAGYVIQMHALEPHRWRPKQSFADLASRGAGAKFEELLTEGRNNRWLLETSDKLEAQAAPAPVVDVAAPMAASFNETLQEAAPADLAPIPLPPPSKSLGEAAAAFGATVQAGLHLLLEAHAHHVLSTLDAKLASIAAEAGQTIAAQIAAQIEHGLRQTVLDTMAAELGGPVKPPAPVQEAAPSFPERPVEDPPPPPAAAPAPVFNAEQHAQARALLAPPAPLNDWQARQAAALLATLKPGPEVPAGQEETFAPKRLKIDVVGFNTPNLEQMVRKEFKNPDFRFFTPDDYQHFSPHKNRHCVMMIDRVPHAIKYKLSAAKVKPILVKGTVGHVIHAIDELHRSKGIPL